MAPVISVDCLFSLAERDGCPFERGFWAENACIDKRWGRSAEGR